MPTLVEIQNSIEKGNIDLDEMRQIIGTFLRRSPEGSSLWDIMTALRGPDSPSEADGMTQEQYRQAYAGRRARKFGGVEIIREHAFFGAAGGTARRHYDDTVTLMGNGDHHDRHLESAARVLGLKIRRK